MKRRALKAKAGFSLPITLTVVTVLTLTFAVTLNSIVRIPPPDGDTSKRSYNLWEETSLDAKRAQFETDAMTAEARLTFLIATEPFNAAMLNVGAPRTGASSSADAIATITLDNRPYNYFTAPDSTSPYLAEIQDEAGLFNLYGASSDQLTRLFQQYGMQGDIDASNLATEMQTYLSETATLHQPVKRASALFSRLPDMASYITPKVWGALADKTTAYADNNSFNINTAPPDVIAVMFNVDLDTAAAIVDQREGTIISSVASVGLVAPTPGRNYTSGSGRLRFTLIDPATGLTYRSTLILTPTDAQRPVWVENPHTLVTTPPTDVTQDDLTAFPDIPDLNS